jgi:hypothetical protein
MKLPVHAILIAALLGSATGWAAAATAVEVFKSPTVAVVVAGSNTCKKWV